MKGRNRLGRFVPGHRLVYPRPPVGPNSGQFRPGCTPVPSRRRRPGDSYLDRKTGEVFVCVPEPNPHFPHRAQHFKPRRLVNWEAAHGPAPPGCVVMRIDGRDRTRDELSNLVLVRRGALAVLNRGNWSGRSIAFNDLPGDRAMRLAAIAVAVLRAGPPYVILPGA